MWILEAIRKIGLELKEVADVEMQIEKSPYLNVRGMKS